VHYGGRVTDVYDQRCMQCLLEKFLPSSGKETDYTFDETGKYFAPDVGTKAESLEYIQALPLTESPSIFGTRDRTVIFPHPILVYMENSYRDRK
jgi:dynein heavy chain